MVGVDAYVNLRGTLSMCLDPEVDFNGHDADGQMRNALNALADTVEDPAEKERFETEMDNFFALFRRYLNDKAKGKKREAAISNPVYASGPKRTDASQEEILGLPVASHTPEHILRILQYYWENLDCAEHQINSDGKHLYWRAWLCQSIVHWQDNKSDLKDADAAFYGLHGEEEASKPDDMPILKTTNINVEYEDSSDRAMRVPEAFCKRAKQSCLRQVPSSKEPTNAYRTADG
ncbi:MAG: hypothetical protein Q9183_004756, partial [Haloplaca sp. 2 TL-2023]